MPDESATSGLAGRLPPEVAAGLGAISRVAQALNRPGSLAELTEHALAEMSGALSLTAAALYLPAAGRRPMLRRYGEASAGPASLPELVFDEEAWRLVVASGHPVVFHERAGWLVENPFDPQADYWFALPMLSSGELVGVVMAARAVPVELDPTTLIVLRLLGDQLSTGITTARLRQELERTALERERMRLAADVHDGLAQDLALAMRELALLAAEPPADAARESLARLSEAISEAHRIVRERLVDLSAGHPLGDLRAAVENVVARFRRRGVPIALRSGDVSDAPPATVAAALLILQEALTNADKHAEAARVEVGLMSDGAWVELTVADDGIGFAELDTSRPGHLGLDVMRQRAAGAGGTLTVHSRPGQGTCVVVRLPADRPDA